MHNVYSCAFFRIRLVLALPSLTNCLLPSKASLKKLYALRTEELLMSLRYILLSMRCVHWQSQPFLSLRCVHFALAKGAKRLWQSHNKKVPLCKGGCPLCGLGDCILLLSIESTTKSAQATDRLCAAGLRLVVDKGASQTINDDCTTSAIEPK